MFFYTNTAFWGSFKSSSIFTNIAIAIIIQPIQIYQLYTNSFKIGDKGITHEKK
jgi:hypothetical protein